MVELNKISNDLAARLAKLANLSRKQLEGMPQMRLSSLLCFLDFILNHGDFRDPEIYLSDEGYIDALWHDNSGPSLYLMFYENNNARLSYVESHPKFNKSKNSNRKTNLKLVSETKIYKIEELVPVLEEMNLLEFVENG